MHWQPLMLYFLLFPLQLCFLLVKNNLSHAISSYLHGKLISWTIAFYMSLCCTVLLRIMNISIFTNRIISLICICQLYLFFFFCNFTSHGICINFENQQIYNLNNLSFFVACVGEPKSVLTRFLGTLLGFQNYELLDFILQCNLVA